MIDLGLFPNLLFLRIHAVSVFNIAMALDTLSTITSSSCIRQIVFSIEAPGVDICNRLDSKMAGLPLSYLESVRLEMGESDFQCWSQGFPRLGSRDLVRRLFHSFLLVLHGDSFFVLILTGSRWVRLAIGVALLMMTATTHRHKSGAGTP